MNREKFPLGFVYRPTVVEPDGRRIEGPPVRNIVPQAGIDYFVGLLRGTATPFANWYLGVFTKDFVPNLGFLSGDLQLVAEEATNYTEENRPIWPHVYDGVGVVDNLEDPVVFTGFSAETTIRGGFICSSSVKGGTSGLTVSIARFESPTVVKAGGKFELQAGFTFVPTNIL